MSETFREWRHWSSLSMGFSLRSERFDPVSAGMEPLPGRLALTAGPDNCRIQAHVELHEPEGEEEYPSHFHFRLICNRSWKAGAESVEDQDIDSFLAAVMSGVMDDDPIAVTLVGDLEMPDQVSWVLPILVDPPDVDGGSTDVGNVTLAGVTLDFEESQVGLSRVFMENDFEQQPSRLRLMANRTISRTDISECLSMALEHVTQLARIFVKGLPND